MSDLMVLPGSPSSQSRRTRQREVSLEMPETQDSFHLYLVRHGSAKPKEEDPDRGLTEMGTADVTRMAEWAKVAGIRVAEIRQSGKHRAQQTAEIYSEQMGCPSRAVSGLAPKDDVLAVAKSLRDETRSIMLVGHLPFLERLAAALIVGNPEAKIVSLDAGALLALERTNGVWNATCLMQPELLPLP